MILHTTGEGVISTWVGCRFGFGITNPVFLLTIFQHPYTLEWYAKYLRNDDVLHGVSEPKNSGVLMCVGTLVSKNLSSP